MKLNGAAVEANEEEASETRNMGRSVFALAISAASLTIGGFGFWYLVGRGLDNEQLGDVAALTSLVLFLSGVTRLNLHATLPAMLPGSGTSGRAVVLRSYAAAAGLGLIVSVAVLIVGTTFSDGLVGLDGSAVWIVPISVVAWSIFSVQDGALVGVNAENLVAVENLTYTAMRLLGALAIAVGLLPNSTVWALATWFLPLAILIPAVNLTLARRLDYPSNPNWKPEGLRRLVAWDLLGGVSQLALTRGAAYGTIVFLPRAEGANLAVIWLFFITVDIGFQQMSSAVTAAATRTEHSVNRLYLRAQDGALVLGLLTTAIGLVLAPTLLSVLIENPSASAVSALRWVFVALGARAVFLVWLSQARATHNRSALVFGPLVALGLFIIAIIPGILTQNISQIALGLALSQWVTTTAILAGFLGKPMQREALPSVASSTSLGSDRWTATLVPADTPPATRIQTLRAHLGNHGAMFTAFLCVVSIAIVTARTPSSRIDFDRVDGYGLISALPPLYWYLLSILLLTFLGFLYFRDKVGAIVSISALILLTHGIEPLTSPHPRFSVAWLLTGFSDMIAQTGANDRFFDARFVWPGFFLAPAAAMTDGQQAPIEFLIRFWPVGIFFIWTAIVWTLARYLFPEYQRAAPIAAWIFTLTAWTGQNYFSPQSIGTTMVAIIVALVLVLEPQREIATSLRERVLWVVKPTRSEGQNTLLISFILLFSAAVVVSHPLSPVFLIVWLAVLAATGHRYARGMPVIVGAMFFSWVAHLGRPWWQTRIDTIVGDIGAVSETVSRSTTERTAEASFERSQVLLGRTSLVLGVAALTCLATAYLYFRKRHPLCLIPFALAVAPAAIVAGQPYGGEIIVRVFLFSIIPSALLIGTAVAAMPKRAGLVALTLLSIVLAPTFLLSRWGNELYEMTRESDFAAIEAAYTEAPDNTLFVTHEAFLSWGYTRLDRNERARNHVYIRLEPTEQVLSEIVDRAASGGFENAVIITAESIEHWGMQTRSLPDGWLEETADFLDAHPDITTLNHLGASGAFLVEVDRDQESSQ